MGRKYSRELKTKVAQEICENGRSTSKVAAEHEIPLKTVENWVTAYNKDHFVYSEDTLRMQQLAKENARLKRENAILKKTIRSFAQTE